MVWFSKITHIQLIAAKKFTNGTCDTKLKFFPQFILIKGEKSKFKDNLNAF